MVFIFFDFILISIQLSLTQGASSVTLGKYLETIKDKKLDGYLLFSKHGVNQIECSLECQSNPQCLSANHHAVKKICQLNRHKNVKDLIEAEGWTFLDGFDKKRVIPEGPDFTLERGKYYYATNMHHILKSTKKTVIGVLKNWMDLW